MRFLERLWIAVHSSEKSRMKYIYKHKIFKKIGTNVIFVPRILPVEPEFIKIGNNVVVAARVTFITHDASHFMFNKLSGGGVEIPYYHGCIQVGNNVFIGSNSTILPNVRIGNNVFIAAGSVVSSDVPDNVVWGGVPAHKLKDFEELYLNRMKTVGKALSDEAYCWETFYAEHDAN